MQEIQVKERVSVLTGSYDDAKIKVFQVRWKRTEYHVARQTAHWTSRHGEDIVEYFTVKTGGGDVLWLQHYRLKNEWWLERITML